MNDSTAWKKLIKLIAEKVANEVKQPKKENESNHLRSV
jgi:hypothetical protein